MKVPLRTAVEGAGFAADGFLRTPVEKLA